MLTEYCGDGHDQGYGEDPTTLSKIMKAGSIAQFVRVFSEGLQPNMHLSF
jgi:hypothetical protein